MQFSGNLSDIDTVRERCRINGGFSFTDRPHPDLSSLCAVYRVNVLSPVPVAVAGRNDPGCRTGDDRVTPLPVYPCQPSGHPAALKNPSVKRLFSLYFGMIPVLNPVQIIQNTITANARVTGYLSVKNSRRNSF